MPVWCRSVAEGQTANMLIFRRSVHPKRIAEGVPISSRYTSAHTHSCSVVEMLDIDDESFVYLYSSRGAGAKVLRATCAGSRERFCRSERNRGTKGGSVKKQKDQAGKRVTPLYLSRETLRDLGAPGLRPAAGAFYPSDACSAKPGTDTCCTPT